MKNGLQTNLCDDLFVQTKNSQDLFPVFDIQETVSHYLVSFDMPAVLGNQVQVVLTHEELIVSGKGGLGKEIQNPEVSLRVQSSSQMITARYQHGLLVIALPKQNQKRRNLK